MQIHIETPHKRRPINDLVGNVESNHNRRREIRLEETCRNLLARHTRVPNRRKRSPELRNENDNIHNKPDVRPDDAGLRAESEFVEGMALHFPAFAEADVREVDRTPGED